MTWILCSVITKPTIRINKHLSPLSDIVTRLDEDFALLLLKNSEARWEDMFSKSSKKSDVPWLYTKQVKTEVSPEGNTAKYSGWSSDEIVEYNRILEKVERDRGRDKAKLSDSVENQYMSGCLTKLMDSGKKIKIKIARGNTRARAIPVSDVDYSDCVYEESKDVNSNNNWLPEPKGDDDNDSQSSKYI